MILSLSPFFYPIDHVMEKNRSTVSPKYNLIHNENNFEVLLDVPGLKDSDLKVVIQSNRIEVTCNQERSTDDNTKKESMRWTRIFEVDHKTLDMDKATAVLSNGVLTVSIPRKPKKTPKNIEILADDSTSNEMEKARTDDTFHVETFIVPGIRKSDLQVVAHDDGTIHVSGLRVVYEDEARGSKKRNVSYSKKVQVDKKSVDTQTMKAFLENGVLTVFGPKMAKSEAMKIPIYTDSDLLEQDSKLANTFAITMDIPGVKPDDVSVTCRDDDIIEIRGSRTHRGSKENTEFKRLYTIDSDVVDLSKLKAYLADGVLTITSAYLINQQPRVLQIEMKSDKTETVN